jgi:hypothetical protein
MTVKEISEIAELTGGARALVKDDSTSATYLDSLEKEKLYQDAVVFLAYDKPVDAAVKWACECIRELQDPEEKKEKNETLEVCEQWAKAPNDEARWAAKRTSDKSNAQGPTKLLAMGVFMSGGSIVGPSAPVVQPPKYAAQKLIASTVRISVIAYLPQNADERFQRAVAMGRGAGQAAKT